MFPKLIYNLRIGTEAIAQNKLRGLLTSLGIVFGVASVITMLAIGRGAQEEILEQMKLLGAENIIVKPVLDMEGQGGSDDQERTESKRFSPGLTLADAESIEKIVPYVREVSPEIVYDPTVLRGGFKRNAKLIGVDNSYFELNNIELSEGNLFSAYQQVNASPVCIIGNGIKTKFFPQENPINKKIKVGRLWLTIIGVVRERNVNEKYLKKLGLRDFNMDIYSPANTVLLRHRNRSLQESADIKSRMVVVNAGETAEARDWGDKNYHQVDKLVVRVNNNDYIKSIAEILRRMLLRRHNQVEDFEIIVPELALQSEQRTKDIFNIVLSSIAAISLLVGGIGIMNIMLASVLERIKEIGVRLSVGATKQDIIMQFLGEATAISISGGIIGIIIGFILSFSIEKLAGIVTIISPISVLLSFFVAMAVGLVFGIFPAKKAAEQDPVESLRYE